MVPDVLPAKGGGDASVKKAKIGQFYRKITVV